MKKVLIVVTSHDELGKTGQKTGYYLSEVTHPYFQLVDAGIQVDIASPKGGKAPVDPKSDDLKDPENKRFIEDPNHKDKLENTLVLAAIDPNQYDAILFAGGHGTMWDFYPNDVIARLAATLYEKGGYVAAVCHGPAALLNIKLSNGDYLIQGKQISAFSNDEENAVGLANDMPFLLESELIARGGHYVKASEWQAKVAVSERLITGQNPASAAGVGQVLTKKLFG